MPLKHHYHPETFELLSASNAKLDPRKKKPLVPALATLVEPPVTGGNQTVTFDIDSESWNVVPDYRGLTYWLPDTSVHTITDLGVEPPVDALDSEPAPLIDDYKKLKIQEVAARVQGVTDPAQAEIGLAFRYAELGLKEVAGTIIPPEQTELDCIKPVVAWRSDIAARYQAIETAINAAGDHAAIDALMSSLTLPDRP